VVGTELNERLEQASVIALYGAPLLDATAKAAAFGEQMPGIQKQGASVHVVNTETQKGPRTGAQQKLRPGV
jgi:hypothetical protein